MRRALFCIVMLSLALGATAAFAQDQTEAFPDSIPGTHPNWVYGQQVDPPFTVSWYENKVQLNGLQALPAPQPSGTTVHPEAMVVDSLVKAAQRAARSVSTQEEKVAAMRQVLDGAPLVSSVEIFNGRLRINWNTRYGVQLGAYLRGVPETSPKTAPSDDNPYLPLIRKMLVHLSNDRLLIFHGGGMSVISQRKTAVAIEQIDLTLETKELVEGPIGESVLQAILDRADR